MEKEESVGQGEKNRHARSDKIKRLGEEEKQGRWETGAVEPRDGPSRGGRAGCLREREKQCRSRGKSGKDGGGTAESPGAPAALCSSPAPTGGTGAAPRTCGPGSSTATGALADHRPGRDEPGSAGLSLSVRLPASLFVSLVTCQSTTC